MEEYKIQKLDKEKWQGTYLPISYASDFYYDVSIQKVMAGFDVVIHKKRFETTFVHPTTDSDKLYEDWWENACAYGIVQGENLLAAMEVCLEQWSNRLLITELFVSEEIRGKGYGKKLIDLAKKITVDNKHRALMLETQSSNVNAIDFYLHEGFTLIGFDSCCYTNHDLDRKEVRLNMGWFPERNDLWR